MIPMPDKPKVVVQIKPDGMVMVASNISPELEVEVVMTDDDFHDAAAGMPFQTDRDPEPRSRFTEES